ncbi:MAG TPA: MFS transporter [Ignavibacteriales bacterium]|nr:MFS transporter [Ignavibacteriales bacterium]
MNNTTIAQKAEPSALFRWMILLFVSLAMFGNYYVYDSISPLADLLAKQLKFSDSEIGLLNAIYSIPNVIMVLIGGIIVDKLGTRISSFIFAFLCFVGAALTASSGDITVMAAGRLVFGLGAESLIVAVTTIIGRWFKGKELSLAFGLNLTVARLGTFAALNSPTWGKSFYNDWQMPLLISVIAGVVSVVSVIVYWGMDTYAEKNLAVKETPKTDEIKLKEIFSFTPSYWFIVMLCITFYSAIFPFQTFAVKFFVESHGVSREMGGFLSSILTLSAMILTPLFGLLSDAIGRRSMLMMIGSALLIPVYLLMAYTHIYLYIPMITMGIAFSLIPAVMWPSVALIVKEEKLGTAYGLMTMIQNIGLAGFNLLIGWANDYSGASAQNPGGYNLGMWIFSSLGFFGLLFAYLLKKSEQGVGGHGLEKPTIGKA